MLRKGRWTDGDIEKLKALAQRRSFTDIAAELGRSEGSIAVKTLQLKISLRVPRKDSAHAQQTGPATRPQQAGSTISE
jgi:hypothetical protein